MRGIHVRLNLKHEPREDILVRPDCPKRRFARSRHWRVLDERLQEELDAEIRQRASETDRGQLASQHSIQIKLSTGQLE